MISQLSAKYDFVVIDTAYVYNTDGKVTNLAFLSVEFENVYPSYLPAF